MEGPVVMVADILQMESDVNNVTQVVQHGYADF